MITALIRGFLIALAGIGMAGCVAMKYKTIPYDTAKPARVARLPGCRDHAPNPNEPCVALVRAGDWQTRSDVEVDAGQAWCIEVPDGQHWFDASRISSPLDGEPGSAGMNTAAGWKRIEGAPWFALGMGVLTKVGEQVDTKAVRDWPAARNCQHLFEPSQPGMLVFFPNDAVPPVGGHSVFYGNNAGQVWVELTRLR
jgi:hypothetical protein